MNFCATKLNFANEKLEMRCASVYNEHIQELVLIKVHKTVAGYKQTRIVNLETKWLTT